MSVLRPAAAGLQGSAACPAVQGRPLKEKSHFRGTRRWVLMRIASVSAATEADSVGQTAMSAQRWRELAPSLQRQIGENARGNSVENFENRLFVDRTNRAN